MILLISGGVLIVAAVLHKLAMESAMRRYAKISSHQIVNLQNIIRTQSDYITVLTQHKNEMTQKVNDIVDLMPEMISSHDSELPASVVIFRKLLDVKTVISKHVTPDSPLAKEVEEILR